MSCYYFATGSTSLFANASIEMQTLLVPLLPATFFPFTGTFTLVDLDNPGDSISGTLTGNGFALGPPPNELPYPLFGIGGVFTTTGGTGAYAGAAGQSLMDGTAIFTFLNDDATFASGEGTLNFKPVPEPSTLTLMLVPLAAMGAVSMRRRRNTDQSR